MKVKAQREAVCTSLLEIEQQKEVIQENDT